MIFTRKKTCKVCLDEKTVDLFHGFTRTCKACFSVKRRQDYLSSPPLTEAQKARKSEAAKRYYEKTKEKRCQHRASIAEKMKAYLKVYNKTYYQQNKSAFAAKSRQRHATKMSASPAWSIRFWVDEAYELAALRSDITGVQYHVDHVVPLNHPLVCGLHAHTNLQVITSVMNIKKGNRVWPDMP